MEINLKTDEKVKIVVDGTCEFLVWGERNEEGTMHLNATYLEEKNDQ